MQTRLWYRMYLKKINVIAFYHWSLSNQQPSK